MAFQNTNQTRYSQNEIRVLSLSINQDLAMNSLFIQFFILASLVSGFNLRSLLSRFSADNNNAATES